MPKNIQERVSLMP